MNVVLEIINFPSHDIFEPSMTFNQNGGKIGRNKQMDWVLHDPSKYISNFHAEITFNNGQYYITDKSTNGTAFKNPKKKLIKDIPAPLTENTVIIIGKYEISVKFSNNSFLSHETSSTQDNTPNNFEIPDQFFTGNETEEAFNIINNNDKSKDILSLVDDDPVSIHNDILPDFDNIIGDIEHNEGSFGGSDLNMHIDASQMGKSSAVDKSEVFDAASNAAEGEDRLFAILATKLGLKSNDMSMLEKEAFIAEIAEVVKTTVEYAQTTAQSISGMQFELGSNSTLSKSLFTKAVSSAKIFSELQHSKVSLSAEIKSLFHEINTHNIALYTAVSNISFNTLSQFSPQRLYFSFEQENLLDKKLANKKALAWDAYSQRYKHLDALVHKEDADMDALKKEYKSILKTLNLGREK